MRMLHKLIDGIDSPDIILADLDGIKCHVAWREELDRQNPDKPSRKVPYDVSDKRPAHGKHVEWGVTRKAANALAKRLLTGSASGGLGIVLGTLFKGYRLVGIDLDGCRDPMTGEIAQWARKLIDRFATYTEVSPSGTGVKLFMLMTESDWQTMGKVSGSFKRQAAKGEKAPGIEVYSEARYFTVTDKRLPNSPEKLAIVSAAEFRCVAEVDGPEFKGESPGRKEGKADMREHNATRAFEGTLDRLREALTFIDPVKHNDYDSWFKIVSATEHETGGSEEGFEIAREWSEGCPDYDEDELREKWESLGRGGGRHLTGAYLLKLAMPNGFRMTEVEFEDLAPSEVEQGLQSRKRSTLRIHYPNDLKSMPPVKHLIRDVIEEGMLSSLIGTPGHGKTFLGLDMLLHIATGMPWFVTLPLGLNPD